MTKGDSATATDRPIWASCVEGIRRYAGASNAEGIAWDPASGENPWQWPSVPQFRKTHSFRRLPMGSELRLNAIFGTAPAPSS